MNVVLNLSIIRTRQSKILIRGLLSTCTLPFFFEGTAWSGWYAPPGFENSNHSARAGARLKNAVVTCDKPPSTPVECTTEAGPCLFNIEDDPCEYVNQAKNQPEIVNNMLQWLEKYRETMVPPRNKPFDPRANPNNFGGVWSPWMDED